MRILPTLYHKKFFLKQEKSLFLPLPKPSIIRPYTHTEDETLDAVAENTLHTPEEYIHHPEDECEHHPGGKDGNEEGFNFILIIHSSLKTKLSSPPLKKPVGIAVTV